MTEKCLLLVEDILIGFGDKKLKRCLKQLKIAHFNSPWDLIQAGFYEMVVATCTDGICFKAYIVR